MSQYGEVMYVVFLSGLRISQEYVPEAIDKIKMGECPVCNKTMTPDDVPDAGESQKYQCLFCDATMLIEAWEVSKKVL